MEYSWIMGVPSRMNPICIYTRWELYQAARSTCFLGCLWACDCSTPPSSHPWKDTNAMNIISIGMNVISLTKAGKYFLWAGYDLVYTVSSPWDLRLGSQSAFTSSKWPHRMLLAPPSQVLGPSKLNCSSLCSCWSLTGSEEDQSELRWLVNLLGFEWSATIVTTISMQSIMLQISLATAFHFLPCSSILTTTRLLHPCHTTSQPGAPN